VFLQDTWSSEVCEGGLPATVGCSYES